MNLFKTLKAMLQVVPKSDVRYYLNGVQVKRIDDTVEFNATDGHILLHVKTTDLSHINVPEFCDFIMCRKSLNVMLKSFNDKSVFTLDCTDDNTVTLGGLPIETVDGRYPDVKRVMTQSSERCDEIGVNYTLLSKISKACATVTSASGKYPAPLLQVRGASDSIRLEQSYDDYSFVGLLMPCRL